MENNMIYSDNANIERSLKTRQTLLAIHGLCMVILSLRMYFESFITYLGDLKYWFFNVLLRYNWNEWMFVEYMVLWGIVLFCSIVMYVFSGINIYLSKAKKPVVYLYPEVQTEVNVKLELDGKVTYSYPEYNNALGWTVTAEPDGQLTDKDGNKYPYLFWEGDIRIKPDLSKGFCVKGEDTESFLKDALRQLGLNDTEAADFIAYWCPEMQQNKYNVITFQTAAYEDVSGLKVSPKPDTVIRVNMLWYATDKPVDIAPQELDAINSVNRKGFTVVEWGGEEYKRGLFP